MKGILFFFVLSGLVTATAAAEPFVFKPVEFSTSEVTIVTRAATHAMKVEVADNDSQRSYGLMNRTALAEEAGMLFVYPKTQEKRYGFWMYRTRIPLDIAFIDEQGKIVSVHQMQPCLSEEYGKCPTYHPDADYRFALEVNHGFFDKKGIGVGDVVKFGRAPGRKKL